MPDGYGHSVCIFAEVPEISKERAIQFFPFLRRIEQRPSESLPRSAPAGTTNALGISSDSGSYSRVVSVVGKSEIAMYLNVTEPQVEVWLAGAEHIPDQTFLHLVDVLAAALKK